MFSKLEPFRNLQPDQTFALTYSIEVNGNRGHKSSLIRRFVETCTSAWRDETNKNTACMHISENRISQKGDASKLAYEMFKAYPCVVNVEMNLFTKDEIVWSTKGKKHSQRSCAPICLTRIALVIIQKTKHTRSCTPSPKTALGKANSFVGLKIYHNLKFG